MLETPINLKEKVRHLPEQPGVYLMKDALGRVIYIGTLNKALFPGLRLGYAVVPPALRSAPVYNDAALGGYLIFVGVRPFIDGRAELYGAAFMARYQKAISGPGSLFADEIAQYHIRWAVVGVRSSAAPLLAALPGWSCAYRDATAALFIRN